MHEAEGESFLRIVHRLIDLALFFRSSGSTGRVDAGDSAVSANIA
jgi:hypothetical protein